MRQPCIIALYTAEYTGMRLSVNSLGVTLQRGKMNGEGTLHINQLFNISAKVTILAE